MGIVIIAVDIVIGLNILLIAVVSIFSSHLHIFVLLLVLLLVLVQIIVHYELLKIVVLGTSEWDKSVTLECITIASTFAF